MSDCDVCALIKTRNDGQDVIVFETKYWRGVLDGDQRTLGKMFITLREHRSSLADLTHDQMEDFYVIVRELECAVKAAFSPTHFNWQCLMNLAVAAGQDTHVHWHFHPRYDRPVELAGHVFKDGAADKTPHPVNHDVCEKIRSLIVSECTLIA